ncbi:MAG: sn-glycerol-3-phosphate ABC transporter ATP-binding protein UgpC [Rhodococcus sp. (in: high G+C Gram-positive bacteria)]
MASVHFVGTTHRYAGADTPSVDALDLDIEDGEFLVLVGPSGCGKSTSLRMLAGLESIESGRIEIGGKDVSGLAPKERDVAMVFQNYALYPNMTVADNMGFALRNAGMSKADTAVRVEEAARMLELEPLLGRRPVKLSGGQRQRVAMGRAIVRRPEVFCMDEPLSNLDAKLRVSTRSQIASLQRRLGTTTVYVTHDQVEAMTMGDRVAVLKGGLLQQVASPRELYADPVNEFVASFIGSPAMNLMDTEVVDGHAVLGGAGVSLPAGHSGRIVVGVRPESWALVGESDPGALEVFVDFVEELGAESFAYCVGAPDAAWNSKGEHVVVRVDRRTTVAPAQRLRVRPSSDEVFFFNPETGVRIR